MLKTVLIILLLNIGSIIKTHKCIHSEIIQKLPKIKVLKRKIKKDDQKKNKKIESINNNENYDRNLYEENNNENYDRNLYEENQNQNSNKKNHNENLYKKNTLKRKTRNLQKNNPFQNINKNNNQNSYKNKEARNLQENPYQNIYENNNQNSYKNKEARNLQENPYQNPYNNNNQNNSYDKNNQNPYDNNNDENIYSDISTEEEQRDETKYRKMRFHLDYSATTVLNPALEIYIKKTVLTEVIRKLSSLIKVKGPYKIPFFEETSCDSIISIPEIYSKNETDTDLILFVKLIYEETGYLAYATPCAMSDFDNRPNIGVISINEKYLSFENGNIKKMVYTLIHEIYHILAISPVLYEYYLQPIDKIMKISTKNGKEIISLTTPKLLKFAKNHYNCPTITGIPLENEGLKASAGSHFEKIDLGNELMTSQMTGNPSLSGFTLNLLEDSGWYKINFDLQENFLWGKNKGCDFFYNCDNNTNLEFCQNESEISCSENYEFKTVCAFSSFSNDCLYKEFVTGYKCNSKYNFIKSSLYEQNGINSRCFNIIYNDIKKSGCYKSICYENKITIEINGYFISCKKGEKETYFEDIVFQCPDFERFCGFKNESCENDCNGNGICLDNKECSCDYFFSGLYCDQEENCHNDDEEICDVLYHLEGLDNFLEAFKTFYNYFLIFYMII